MHRASVRTPGRGFASGARSVQGLCGSFIQSRSLGRRQQSALDLAQCDRRGAEAQAGLARATYSAPQSRQRTRCSVAGRMDSCAASWPAQSGQAVAPVASRRSGAGSGSASGSRSAGPAGRSRRDRSLKSARFRSRRSGPYRSRLLSFPTTIPANTESDTNTMSTPGPWSRPRNRALAAGLVVDCRAARRSWLEVQSPRRGRPARFRGYFRPDRSTSLPGTGPGPRRSLRGRRSGRRPYSGAWKARSRA